MPSTKILFISPIKAVKKKKPEKHEEHREHEKPMGPSDNLHCFLCLFAGIVHEKAALIIISFAHYPQPNSTLGTLCTVG